jgi:hypothetical protein
MYIHPYFFMFFIFITTPCEKKINQNDQKTEQLKTPVLKFGLRLVTVFITQQKKDNSR